MRTSSIPSFDPVEIRRRITMTAAVGLMRDAFLQLSGKSATIPIRTVIESQDNKGVALFMPSYSSQWKLFGLKMVSVFPGNAPPLPVIQGNMMVMSADTGEPLALFDAASVTALRTGAASGLATELLSRRDSSVLGIFGTGTQALTQAEGVCAVRHVEQIFVKGTSRAQEEHFCEALTAVSSANARPMDGDTLRECDIICTATTSHQPLFHAHDVKAGVHINGIGSFTTSMREIPGDVISSCRLIVDHHGSALAEAGDIVIPIREGLISEEHIHAELGEVVAGTKSGRTSDSQITVFKSVGNAIQDLAIAHYLVNT